MRIVFLNSLEKRSSNAVSGGAQVWIGEEEGLWRMGWNETTAEGEQETIWYEGGSWSEMLHVYRHRLVVKLGEGYRPVIEGIWDEREEFQGRGMAAQKLICYSELHGNEEFYNELCAWRRKKASADRKAPYMIASNRLLRLISVFKPWTTEELLQLPGVGESKAAEYGPELLEMAQAQGANGRVTSRLAGWSKTSMRMYSDPGYISRRRQNLSWRWRSLVPAALYWNPWPKV